MATTSDQRTAGGKITKSRRVPPASRTPYTRPVDTPEQIPPIEDPENPNWLSGLIYPAKMIASGAGKILSFFGTYSSDSSDSGGDSSDDDDDDSEEIENKVLSPPCKSDNKRTIERLVTQETFSREEGNQLIRLIKSRVVNGNRIIDDNAANMRTTAVMEARKWLQEKKSGSKKKMEGEFDLTYLTTPSQVRRLSTHEKGSPQDVAKSYMQNRPAWSSPSLKITEARSSSPFRMERFIEETPRSSLRSSELKKGSLTSGSWNILEEIRRVRSKVTEELLASTPLTKISLSPFSPQNNHTQESSKNHTGATGAAPAESSHGRPQEVVKDAAAASLPSRVSQGMKDGDAIQSMELQGDPETADCRLNEENDPKSTAAENGFSTNVSSIAAGDDETPNAKKPGEENGDLADSSHDVHVVEPTTNVMNTGPTETVLNGSQNSSSMQHEEQTADQQPSRSRASSDTQKERKSKGYSRRGRGRGK